MLPMVSAGDHTQVIDVYAFASANPSFLGNLEYEIVPVTLQSQSGTFPRIGDKFKEPEQRVTSK